MPGFNHLGTHTHTHRRDSSFFRAPPLPITTYSSFATRWPQVFAPTQSTGWSSFTTSSLPSISSSVLLSPRYRWENPFSSWSNDWFSNNHTTRVVPARSARTFIWYNPLTWFLVLYLWLVSLFRPSSSSSAVRQAEPAPVAPNVHPIQPPPLPVRTVLEAAPPRQEPQCPTWHPPVIRPVKMTGTQEPKDDYSKLSLCSTEVQTYVKDCIEKNVKLSDNIKELGLMTDKETRLFEEYLDAVKYDYMRIPVTLGGRRYDITTLFTLHKQEDPYNRKPFNWNDIKPGGDIIKACEGTIQIVRDNRADEQPQAGLR